MYKVVYLGTFILMVGFCGYTFMFRPVDRSFIHVSGKETELLAGWMMEAKSYGWPVVCATYCRPQVDGKESYWQLHYASMAANLVLWCGVSLAVAHTAAGIVARVLDLRNASEPGERDGSGGDSGCTGPGGAGKRSAEKTSPCCDGKDCDCSVIQ